MVQGCPLDVPVVFGGIVTVVQQCRLYQESETSGAVCLGTNTIDLTCNIWYILYLYSISGSFQCKQFWYQCPGSIVCCIQIKKILGSKFHLNSSPSPPFSKILILSTQSKTKSEMLQTEALEACSDCRLVFPVGTYMQVSFGTTSPQLQICS